MFAVGLLLGLVVGLFLWLPETMLIAGIMIELLHLPGNMSAGANLAFSLALYGIWLALVLAPLLIRLVSGLMGKLNPEEKYPRLGFFRGLLCSMPLPTLYINYAWQTSGVQ